MVRFKYGVYVDGEWKGSKWKWKGDKDYKWKIGFFVFIGIRERDMFIIKGWD